MMNIFRKSISSSTAKISSSRSTPIENSDELSAWEIVNASHSDDDQEIYSLDTDSDTISIISESKYQQESEDDDEEEEKIEKNEEELCDSPKLGHSDDVMALESLSVSPPPITFPVELTRHHAIEDVEEEEDQEEESDDDDVYGDDDDELMQWKLKGRFGKQGIRKLGKKYGPSSKRLPYYYHNRPGYVYGKHGLASQRSYI